MKQKKEQQQKKKTKKKKKEEKKEKEKRKKESTHTIQRKDVNTLKIKLHPHTWVCAQHIHKHLHIDMPLKQTLGS